VRQNYKKFKFLFFDFPSSEFVEITVGWPTSPTNALHPRTKRPPGLENIEGVLAPVCRNAACKATAGAQKSSAWPPSLDPL
jgi:hypothetical protein